MDVKQTSSVNDESNFIFIVPVLTVEFRKHCVEPGRARVHIDHVGGDVAANDLEPFDLVRVCRENLVGRSVCRNRTRRIPSLVIDSDAAQAFRYIVATAKSSILVGNYDHGHGSPPEFTSELRNEYGPGPP